MAQTVENFLHTANWGEKHFFIPQQEGEYFPPPEQQQKSFIAKNRFGSTITINKRLGRGSFGVVYDATIGGKSTVQAAVKFYFHYEPDKPSKIYGLTLRNEIPLDFIAEYKFGRRISAAPSCSTLAVCQLEYGILRIDSSLYYPFIIYEKMEGDGYDLISRAVTHAQNPNSKHREMLPIMAIVFCAMEGFRLMRRLHAAKIYHFDFKVTNMLWKNEAGDITLKLADFGNACSLVQSTPYTKPCSCDSGCTFIPPDWGQDRLPNPNDDLHAVDADVYSFSASIFEVMEKIAGLTGLRATMKSLCEKEPIIAEAFQLLETTARNTYDERSQIAIINLPRTLGAITDTFLDDGRRVPSRTRAKEDVRIDGVSRLATAFKRAFIYLEREVPEWTMAAICS